MQSSKLLGVKALIFVLVLATDQSTATIKAGKFEQSSNSTGRQGATGDKQTIGHKVGDGNVGNNKTKSGELDAAPSITSVHHQVWTSSSSDSLDELSPELIGKLRQDVPFLAAYALRPRLVGGIPPAPTVLPSAVSLETPTLLSAASSPRAARQTLLVGDKSGPKSQADFSEFNEETSTLSKSEHRQRRKTSLVKRKSNTGTRKPLTALELTGRRSASSKPSKQKSGSFVASAKSGAKRVPIYKSTRRANRARNKAKKSRLRARSSSSARQRGKTSAAGTENELDNDNDFGREMGATKGGTGAARTGKRPFFAAVKPRTEQGDTSTGTDLPTDNEDGKNATTTTQATNEADDENELDRAPAEDGDELDDEPRRVGDDDVEEDGDTVLVEPKSDGVDDDPEPPSDGGESDVENELDDEPERERELPGAAAGSGGGAASGAGNSLDRPAQSHERGKRIGRERPNIVPQVQSDDNDDEHGAAGPALGGGQAAGGGIGASTGASGRRPASESPGVEFVHDGDERDRGQGDAGRAVTGANGGTGAIGDQGKGGSTGAPDTGDSDLDYFDEIESDRRATDGRRAGAGPPDAVRPQDVQTGQDDGVDPNATPPGSGAAGERDKDCDDDDDGRYKPREEKYHDEHHQLSDWLRGSIPGEPDDDYPILDRVTNRTSFRCSSQKQPGYYADVEARCQIFHICQADGRQDSFLCPNGTIFSQKALVCVWWSGFDCEDAPKYYHLNELLYKSTGSLDSPQSAAMPNSPGASDGLMPATDSKFSQPIRPRGMRTDMGADEDSSIDSLLQTMRRRNSGGTFDFDSAERKQGSKSSVLASDDEAITQRKSADIDSDLARGSPSRLQSRDNIPRRRRRASARQAPPKLKSRRVMRNSRRRKLRHGVKPKRRA